MLKLVGPLLLAIGTLDVHVALFEFAPQFLDIVEDGVFNAVWWPAMSERMFAREAAFWHLFAGLAMTLIGGLAYWAQKMTGTLPGWFGWALVIFGLLGISLMPVSGFWAFFVPALFIFLQPQSPSPARIPSTQRR